MKKLLFLMFMCAVFGYAQNTSVMNLSTIQVLDSKTIASLQYQESSSNGRRLGNTLIATGLSAIVAGAIIKSNILEPSGQSGTPDGLVEIGETIIKSGIVISSVGIIIRIFNHKRH